MLTSVKGNIVKVHNSEKLSYLTVAENFTVTRDGKEEKKSNFWTFKVFNGLRSFVNAVAVGTFCEFQGHLTPERYDKETETTEAMTLVLDKMTVISSKALRDSKKPVDSATPAEQEGASEEQPTE